MSHINDLFGEVIHCYTRAEAIADGVLVDVSLEAREAGITYPVAVTWRVWDDVVVPDAEALSMGESNEGRLWDVVWMLRAGIAGATEPSTILRYRLYASFHGRRRLVTLKAICGPGDDAAPVITVMLPEED